MNTAYKLQPDLAHILKQSKLVVAFGHDDKQATHDGVERRSNRGNGIPARAPNSVRNSTGVVAQHRAGQYGSSPKDLVR